MLADKDLLSIQEVRSKVDKAYQASLKYQIYTSSRWMRLSKLLLRRRAPTPAGWLKWRLKKPATATPKTSTSRTC